MAKSKTKKNQTRDINLDIIKRDAAERRKEDIEAHGKPTALRTTTQRNKKAYTRKNKHKLNFTTSDIMEMVEECVKIIKGGL